jgi:hypothetical protein
MSTLTEREAYLAMYAFLEAHFSRTASSDVGALLGELSCLPDGEPADPAVVADWAKAVSDARKGLVSADLRVRPE